MITGVNYYAYVKHLEEGFTHNMEKGFTHNMHSVEVTWCVCGYTLPEREYSLLHVTNFNIRVCLESKTGA